MTRAKRHPQLETSDMTFDLECLHLTVSPLFRHLTSEQKDIYDTIIHCVLVKPLAIASNSHQCKLIIWDDERAILAPKNIDDRECIQSLKAHGEEKLALSSFNFNVFADSYISAIHKYVRDLYAKRFPELESLITAAPTYLTTVKKLGNDIDSIKNNADLQQYLPQATIMVVSVTASTTQGKSLTQEELRYVYEACDMAEELQKCKERILEYVESRMTFIAPNISQIIGAPTAAKLLGVAGGLTSLSKMPACNVLLLGQQRKVLSGFSQTQVLPHTGLVYYCPTVQNTSPDLRRKVARLVAAKCTLAARIDSSHESPDGKYGREMVTEIVKKLDKLQEPPPVKSVKALPAPIEAPRKRRGGKRVRKQKERLAQSELRKQYNRMAFGEIEEDAYQDDLGYTRGMLGKGGPGRLRGPTVDEKTKVRISKSLQKNLQKTQAYGGTTTVKRQVAGTASSVAFTPLQGLEIVNPHAAEKVREAGNKYFSGTMGFTNIQPKSSTSDK
nr:EOG090X06EY [Artemia franciscana]